MTGWIVRIVGLGMMAVLAVVPGLAQAFCVVNQTAETVHVQALDSGGWQADVPPKGRACCEGSHCGSARQGHMATVLAVTGYVPVSRSQAPGWNAECRAQVPPRGMMIVTGALNRIACRTGQGG